MKAKLLIFLIGIMFPFVLVCGQTVAVKGKIIDRESRLGIGGVHIYTAAEGSRGTISNEDGDFVLKLKNKSNRLIVSHINYVTREYTVKDPANFLFITLDSASFKLNEIVVAPIKAIDIMREVVERLEDNHRIEPIYYNFYTRIINFSHDSTLNFLEEHTGTILHKKNHNSEFSLEKSRLGHFSEEGRKISDSYRMIGMTEMYTDNLFKYLEDFLHKRKIKRYHYQYVDDVEIMGTDCFVINFHTDRDTYYKAGTLYIDKSSYAVVKKVLDGGGDRKEVTFTKVSDKWYLSNVSSCRRRRGYLEQKITLYNISEETQPANSFIAAGRLWPKKAKNYTGNFDDSYWSDINFIPLPDWIKKQVAN